MMIAIVTQGRCSFPSAIRRRGLAAVASCTASKAFFSSTPTTPVAGGKAGFDTVGCVGLGLMGHGICQVAAASGVHSKVIAYEKEQKFLGEYYCTCFMVCAVGTTPVSILGEEETIHAGKQLTEQRVP